MDSIVWQNYCESFVEEINFRHEKMTGKSCDLNHPKTFTEKLEWLKVYDSIPLKTKCADKLEARQYVRNKLGVDISIPVIKVYDSFNEIDFNELPSNYVLKTNHGSHTNIVVKNKTIDTTSAKNKFDEWMSKDWSWWGYEFHYIPIKRKIFAEEYKENLMDYKFFCFNGNVKYCQVDMHEKENRINFYDTNWNILTWMSNSSYPANIKIIDKKPKKFDLMKNYASILSKDFKFVRVDLYDSNDDVYFGELTFIPGAAYFNYTNENTDKIVGDYLKL